MFAPVLTAMPKPMRLLRRGIRLSEGIFHENNIFEPYRSYFWHAESAELYEAYRILILNGNASVS
jgi:hypothetical protein